MSTSPDIYGFKEVRFARKGQRQFIVASCVLGVVFLVLVILAISRVVGATDRIFSSAVPNASSMVKFDLDGARQIKRLERTWTME